MNRKTVIRIALLGLFMALQACGSSPKVSYYSLNSVQRLTHTEDIKPELKDVAIKVGPITVPDVLEQPQIVSRQGKNGLIIDEFNRWAGDFQYDLQRVLAENLSVLLSTEKTILFQENSPIKEDFQLLVNVRQFSGELGGSVMLNVDWTLSQSGQDEVLIAKKSIFKEMANDHSYAAYVEAQSELLLAFSEEIADEIQKVIR